LQQHLSQAVPVVLVALQPVRQVAQLPQLQTDQ
jgi:hypothetical protein